MSEKEIGSLVITRNPFEKIKITCGTEEMIIEVVKINRGQVKLCLRAPKNWKFTRMDKDGFRS